MKNIYKMSIKNGIFLNFHLNIYQATYIVLFLVVYIIMYSRPSQEAAANVIFDVIKCIE